MGITVSKKVVQAVIDYCSGNSRVSSLYQLYTNDLPTFQAAKQTIYKIKRLYDAGELSDYVECLHSERLASNPEVDAPIQLDANRTTQALKSDGLRPGVLVQFPPLSFATAIQRFIDNEQAKFSVLSRKLENYPRVLAISRARKSLSNKICEEF